MSEKKRVITGETVIGGEYKNYNPTGNRAEYVKRFEKGVEALDWFGDKEKITKEMEAIVSEKDFDIVRSLIAEFWLKYLGVDKTEEGEI